MLLSTDYITVHAEQGHGELLTEHMVSRLAGSADVGLWKTVTCCSLHFHPTRQAGSSADQELMAKSSMKPSHLCDKPEYRGGQQPKPCRDSGIGVQY